METIRDTLFGDVPLAQWPEPDPADSFPWSSFVAARSHLAERRLAQAVSAWRDILAMPGLESRHYLQAWHFLRQQGEQPPKKVAKDVLGAVVEVGMPQGPDILAGYADRSARYYNLSGAGVVWERPDESLDAVIDQLLADGARVVAKIGPWTKERPVSPPSGQVRLSFLTPSGLHFGQGPMNGLASDALAGPVIQSAIRLMQALTRKA
jgi:hypothetical protein